MSNKVIAILFSIGVSVWLYVKIFHMTGGNQKTSILASIFIGLIVLLVSWISLNSLFHS